MNENINEKVEQALEPDDFLRCSKCNSIIEDDMQYCGACGHSLKWRTTKCESCGVIVPIDNFCEKCGEPITENQNKFIIEWNRENKEIVCFKDIKYAKPDITFIIVEKGIVVFIMQTGNLITKLPAGKHSIKQIKEKQPAFDENDGFKVLFIDKTPVYLKIDNIKNILTKDNVNVEISLKILFEISKYELFFNTIVKNNKSVNIDYIRDYVEDYIRSKLKVFVRNIESQEVCKNVEFYKKIKSGLSSDLKKYLETVGINLLELCYITIEDKKWIALMDKQGELKLNNISEKNRLLSEFENKLIKNDYELKNKNLEISQKINEEEMNKKERKLVKEKLDREQELELYKLKTKEDKSNFLVKLYSNKKINEYELKQLAKELFYKNKEYEMAQSYMLAKNDILNKHQLQKLRNAFALDMQEDLYKKRLKDTTVEQEINKIKRLAELEVQIKKAETEAEVNKIEQEMDKLELENALELRKKTNEIKRQEKIFELGLEKRKSELEQKLFLDKVKELSKVSADALISVSDYDKAKLITELEKLRLKQYFTENQILAMSAENEPEIAYAFAEKFKNMGADKIEELYKKIIEQKESSNQDLKQLLVSVLQNISDK